MVSLWFGYYQSMNLFIFCRGINWEVVTSSESKQGIPPLWNQCYFRIQWLTIRADGQNEKSIVEERKGDEQMQMPLIALKD